MRIGGDIDISVRHLKENLFSRRISKENLMLPTPWTSQDIDYTGNYIFDILLFLYLVLFS